jgi:hypothetical protein
MADLVDGRYPQVDQAWSMLGQPTNVVQADLPAFSNFRVLGLGNPTDGALGTTGVATAVPIPVDYGTIISKVSILAGATAEGTGTHAWAALYSGIAVPALLAQSTDNTGAAAVGASARFDFTLASTVQITPANAPNGYVYASIMVAATQMPTAAVMSIPTAIGYQWYSTGPLGFSLTHGSSLAATAPATIASPAAKAVAPIVILT